MALTRRGFVSAAAALGFAATKSLAVDAAPAATRAPGTHGVMPLPFVPSRIKGLSERLLTSHHENNYAGAVKNLNKVEAELAATTRDTPGFILSGLRERELAFRNSVILHELYFANLGGDGKPGAAVEKELAGAFGGAARWEEALRATAMSLAGGSGWAIMGMDLTTGGMGIHWSGNHTQATVNTYPLLVLDMYEHAYHLDFGAAAARYVDAFFQNVQWDEVSRRVERGRRAHAVLRG